MERREFIKSAMAALLASSLPIYSQKTTVVYYLDLAIADLNLPRAVIWGDPQQYAIVKLSHKEIIGKPLDVKDDLFYEKIANATGLSDFKLEPHPWQAELEKRFAEVEQALDLEDERLFGDD